MSRGWVVPIGGAEEKLRDVEILRRFAELCGGEEATIGIVPTASQRSETGSSYRRLFRDLGVREVPILPFDSRADAGRTEHLETLERLDGIFLTGGNQLRLSTTLGGTPAAELIRQRHAAGLHVAGTSAGAAYLSRHMIAFGDEGSTPRADLVTLAPGLGLTHEAIIDQHFRERDRLGRLLSALAYNPRPIGIGLDEDTAAFIAPNRHFEVAGSGAITVVDASDIEYSSMDSARRHDPVCILNVRLHILIEGARFDFANRRAVVPEAVSTET